MCAYDDNCDTRASKRTVCNACRYKKCTDVGMSKSGESDVNSVLVYRMHATLIVNHGPVANYLTSLGPTISICRANLAQIINSPETC